MFKRIYALAVCFAAMMCIAISIGVALFDILQLTAPQWTVDAQRYQSVQAGRLWNSQGAVMINEHGERIANRIPTPTAEELKAQEEARRLFAFERESQSARRSLLQIFTILLVSIPLFISHWRLSRRLDDDALHGSRAEPGTDNLAAHNQ